MGPGLKSTPTRNILFFDITLQELPSVQHIDLNDPDAAQKLQYDYIRFKVSKKYPYDVVVCEYTVINTQYGLLVSALRGDALIQSLPQLLNDRADSGFDTAVLTAICLLVAICVALTAGRTLFAALKNRLIVVVQSGQPLRQALSGHGHDAAVDFVDGALLLAGIFLLHDALHRSLRVAHNAKACLSTLCHVLRGELIF